MRVKELLRWVLISVVGIGLDPVLLVFQNQVHFYVTIGVDRDDTDVVVFNRVLGNDGGVGNVRHDAGALVVFDDILSDSSLGFLPKEVDGLEFI